MYETVYEITKNPLPMDAIYFLVAVVILAVLFGDKIEIILSDYRKRKCWTLMNMGRTGIAIVMGLFLIVLIYCFVDTISYGGSENHQFSKKYYRGNYEVVEGKVKDFRPKYVGGENYHQESFIVEDVYFQYADAIKVGFQNTSRVIESNGQEVRVFYIPFEIEPGDIRNVIVKLELKSVE